MLNWGRPPPKTENRALMLQCIVQRRIQNTVLLERLVAASPTEDREAISLAELALIS